MQIQGVLFDFGNTLISLELDWDKIIPQNIENMVKYLNSKQIPVNIEPFGYRFVNLKEQYHQKARENLIEYPATDILHQLLIETGYSNVPLNYIEEAIDAYFSPEEKLYPIIEGAYQVLDKLKSMGIKLAIVSNASSGDLIRKAIQNQNLSDYFNSVVVSADIGIRKPHPKIFQQALLEIDISPQQAVMIGDIPSYDIAGPQQIGLKTIWAKYVESSAIYNIAVDDSIRPDAIAYKITDIPEIIRGWNEL